MNKLIAKRRGYTLLYTMRTSIEANPQPTNSQKKFARELNDIAQEKYHRNYRNCTEKQKSDVCFIWKSRGER